MSARKPLTVRAIDAFIANPGGGLVDPVVSHPCGTFGRIAWLRSRPTHSAAVQRRLLSDAGGTFWNRCSFAHELQTARDNGLPLIREARRLVGWYERQGSPRPWAAVA